VQRADRVFERVAGDDVGGPDAALRELDDLVTRGLGDVRAARVDRRNRGTPRGSVGGTV
jgi:hypothetical protein